MVLLELTLTDHERRCASAFVLRSALPGTPALTVDQPVVVRDERGSFFSGTVLDAHEDGEDAGYLVRLGVQMPESYALLRLGLPVLDADGTVRPVRTTPPTVPLQRKGQLD